ncbi:Cobalamin-independent synthase family protein [Perilla frutescens var. frutescens]|nr:Cobalamin-independent synthase family protein [Perilla frutescens var. frutescens]
MVLQRPLGARRLVSNGRGGPAIDGLDKLVVSTSCSLLHTAVDLVNENKLDKELNSWFAFATQKLLEVNALAKTLSGQKDELSFQAFFSANATAQASRRSSLRVTNEDVQKAIAALKESDHRRATNVAVRLEAQQEKLNLPMLPTTTIGSFPQTVGVRKIRREYKAGKQVSFLYYFISSGNWSPAVAGFTCFAAPAVAGFYFFPGPAIAMFTER